MNNFKESAKKAWNDAKFKARELGRDVTDWAWNHQELVKTYTPVILGVSACGARVAANALKMRKAGLEKAAKDLYVWDPKMGMYWQIRRALSNAEKLKIQERFKTGEMMGDILASMKILK